MAEQGRQEADAARHDGEDSVGAGTSQNTSTPGPRRDEARADGDFRTQFLSTIGTIHAPGSTFNFAGTDERSDQEPGTDRGFSLAAEHDRVRPTYVEPPGHGIASAELRSRHLLVLSGRRGVGKRTTGIMCLAQLCPDGQLSELPPDQRAREMSDRGVQPGRGYLIDRVDLDEFGAGQPAELRRLGQQLQAARSYLVVTSEAALTSHLLESGALAWSPPDVRAVFDRHCGHEVSLKPCAFQARGTLAELLGPEPELAAVVRLAEVLRDCDEPTTLDDLQLRLGDRARSEVAAWFRGSPEREDLLLVLSLAVMDGAELSALDRAEALLRSDHKPAADDAFDGLVHRFSRVAQLERCHAEAYTTEEPGRYGTRRVTRARFRQRGFRGCVLEHVWCADRDSLLRWLALLVGDELAECREAAARAAATLADVDATVVIGALVRSWATDERRAVRLGAVQTIDTLATNDAHIQAAVRVAREWSASRDPRLLWSATGLWAGALGRRFGEAALRSLADISRRSPAADAPLSDLLALALACLLLSGRDDPRYGLLCLNRLALMARRKDAPSRNRAAEWFLAAADIEAELAGAKRPRELAEIGSDQVFRYRE